MSEPLVVLTFQKRLVAVHATTGERAWEYETDFKANYQYLRVVDGRVFYVAKKSLLCAYAVEDGRELWHDPFKGYGIYGGAMAAPGVDAPRLSTRV